jgi:hypothetical protein
MAVTIFRLKSHHLYLNQYKTGPPKRIQKPLTHFLLGLSESIWDSHLLPASFCKAISVINADV